MKANNRSAGTPASVTAVINKSDDIAVICRIRPPLVDESTTTTSGSNTEIVQIIEPNGITIGNDNGSYKFAFDAVLGPRSTQVDVFNRVGKNVVDCVLDGFNATVFAYGQTSAGKTHTMLGIPEDPGLIIRFAERLFERIENSPTWLEYSVQTQYVEIYLERVRDLLEERSVNPKQVLVKQNLQIREDVLRGVHIPDATIKYMCNAQELLQVCEVARLNRATSETLMNQVSSRSHSVLLLFVTQKDLNTGSSKTSKINLVDLAGSEAVKRSGAEGDRLSEAQAINSSLSALGNVIHALTSDKATYIPYRDSKLTRLLQESLGGNAKTWLIVNISPSVINVSETLSTLRFGQRAKSVKNRAVINQVRSVQELEEALRHAQEKIARQEEIITQLSSSNNNREEDGSITEATSEKETTLQLENAELLEQVQKLTKERDEARVGWEKSQEAAAITESEARTEIIELRNRLEAALVKITDLESSSAMNGLLLVGPTNPGSAPPSPPSSPSSPSSSSASLRQKSLTTTATTPEKKKLPSELRLDQLVQVHRQLLRKYATLELALAESKHAIAIGDERIRSLARELATMSVLSPDYRNASAGSSRVAKVLRGGGGKNNN